MLEIGAYRPGLLLGGRVGAVVVGVLRLGTRQPELELDAPVVNQPPSQKPQAPGCGPPEGSESLVGWLMPVPRGRRVRPVNGIAMPPVCPCPPF